MGRELTRFNQRFLSSAKTLQHFIELEAFGRSVIIGFQKTQIYQWFAGSRQEVFILKIQNSENNAAYVDSRRRFI